MSYADCIRGQLEGLQKNVGLTKAESDRLLDEYDRLLIQYSGTMDSSTAAAKAASDFVKVKAKEISVKNNNNKRYVLQQQAMVKDIDERLNNYRQFYEGLNKAQRYVFRKPDTYMKTIVQDKLEEVFVRHASLRGRYYYMLAEVADKNAIRYGGFRNKNANMEQIVRKMVDDDVDVDPQSADMAKQIRKVMELAHRNFENSGGLIGRLDNYFPQRVHNERMMSKVSADQWKADLFNRLDRERMIDEETGLPIADDKLDRLLDDMYTEVTGIGRTKSEKRAREGAQIGLGGDVSIRRNKARFLHFKTADDFLEYNRQYGFGDEALFDMVLSHLDGMARDTAVMQKLGPKPNAMMRNMSQILSSNALETRFVEGMYEILTGSNSQPVRIDTWYRALEGFKNIQRAAFLGSAPVSALSDSMFLHMATKGNGLPGTSVLSRYARTINPASKTDRQIARNTFFVSESINGMMMGAARWTGDSPIDGKTRRIASVVNNISGLQGMTNAAKTAIGLEGMGFLATAKASRLKYDDLDSLMRGAMEEVGLTRSDWDVIMRSEEFEIDGVGAKFIRPEDVGKLDENVGLKLNDWITKMGLMASNEPTLRSQTITSGAFVGPAQAGSFNRAFFSSVTMFKSFPITMMLNHLVPAVRRAAVGDVRDLVTMAIGTTIIGGIAMQTKELLKGREPRDMDTAAFWKAAAMQGGGFGPLGDFMFSEYSRFGRSPMTDLMGPVAGSASDAARVLMGNFERAVDEDREADFFADLFNFTTRHTPGQNLWYSRLAVERVLFDQVEQLVDPDFSSGVRRQENRLRDDFGSEFWWTPGELSPD